MTMLEDDQRLRAALNEIGEMILEVRRHYKNLRDRYKEEEKNNNYERVQLEIKIINLEEELAETKQLLREAEADKPTQ